MHPLPPPSPPPPSPPLSPRGRRYPLVHREKAHTSTGFPPSWGGTDLSPRGSPSRASWPQAALASGVPKEPRWRQTLLPPCRACLSSGFSLGCLTPAQGRPWGAAFPAWGGRVAPPSGPRPLRSLLPSFLLPDTPSPSRCCYHLSSFSVSIFFKSSPLLSTFEKRL